MARYINYMPVSGPIALLSMGELTSLKKVLVMYGQKYKLHASKRSHCSLVHGRTHQFEKAGRVMYCMARSINYMLVSGPIALLSMDELTSLKRRGA
jgi:hypothetical protein